MTSLSQSLRHHCSEQPQVAVVIDDVADDLELMDDYASLGIPLTFAILPRGEHSEALAEKAHRLNFAVILHLPMEPLDLSHHNPGQAALYLSMSPDQLFSQFEQALASVPNVVGINNHMGSAFTADIEKMRLVMHWVKQRNLFFLDSRTNRYSVAPRVASECGISCLVNETFLDNTDDRDAIEQQLERVLSLAKCKRRTIAIGHYSRKHLVQALANEISHFRVQGVHWVTLSRYHPPCRGTLKALEISRDNQRPALISGTLFLKMEPTPDCFSTSGRQSQAIGTWASHQPRHSVLS